MKTQTIAEVPVGFIKHFVKLSVDENFVRKFYVDFGKLNGLLGRCINPTSSLYEDFGICDDDLDETTKSLVAQSNRKTPSRMDLSKHHPVRTVEDLLLFVYKSPQK